MVYNFHLDAKNEEKVKKILKISLACLKIYLQMRAGEWNFAPLLVHTVSLLTAGLGGLLGCASAGDQEVAGSIPTWQLSVSGERMCTILVNRLED